MLKTPTRNQIARIIEGLGISASGDEISLYRDLVEGSIAGNAALDHLPDDEVQPGSADRMWKRPEPAQNPFNAWYVKTDITGAESGVLQGRSVAIKDNVFVAGVPLMDGSKILDGYTPPVDATVVTRILDAGGAIAGKAVCEAFCFSGGSHTSDSGPVQNPHNTAHSTGGSSSGSGALVAGGEVDLAIGCDQGGSIRIPSSFCGIYGLKPTHGLVPYTGILGMGPVIDHVGPMTASVADNALLLEVIAGKDGLDSRQYNPRTDNYTESLQEGIEGLRVGVVVEGFGHESSEPDVDAKVRGAAEILGEIGAVVKEISIPMHRLGPAISFAVIQQTIDAMFYHDGCLINRLDPVTVSFLDAQHAWRERANELPETIKVMLMATEFLKQEHGYHYVAKGTNLVRQLRSAYDDALKGVDLLLVPTTPMKAPRLPGADVDPAISLALAFDPLINTMPFDNTHHPAMSVPCGMSNGLPVGMMLVGRHFEESTIYRAAHAFETGADWCKL
jgi:amidase